MTASGQSRRFGDVRATSALPLITDVRCEDQQVRKVASGGHGAYELTPALPAVSWDRSARFATMFSNAVMRTVELRRH
jgi:hypothetical protein